MNRRRYTYTPRRRAPSRGFSPPPVAFLAVAVVGAIGVLIISSSGGGEAEAPSPAPGNTLAILGSSCAPWQRCGAAAQPTVTPREDEVSPPRATPMAPGDAAPPPITGVATVIMEASCGDVLYSANPDMRRPPASLTKIMTALVAESAAPLDELVAVDVSGAEFSLATDSTIMGLEPGQTLTMRDLLYGLLLPSGNDAAVQIAEHIGGNLPGFVQMMNDRAREMGLKNTHFANPHGLDENGLYTSAYDIAVLGRELLARPALAEIVSTQAYQPSWDGPAVGNLNQLLTFYPGTLGIKTGYTPLAGQTIVAAAQQGGRTIIVAVLGSHWDIYKDVTELLNWGFQNTEPACGADGLSLAHP